MSPNIQAFLKTCGFEKADLFPLKQDASAREYYRLSHNGKSYVLMDSSKSKEWVEPFILIDKHLRIRVPSPAANINALSGILTILCSFFLLGHAGQTNLLNSQASDDLGFSQAAPKLFFHNFYNIQDGPILKDF